jgi:hypothetical protein
MKNFNPLAARLLVAALRQEDNETALQFALDLTDDPYIVSIGISPGKKYTTGELADLVESHLPLIEGSTVNMVWGLYIPIVIGAVSAWLADEVLGEDTPQSFPEE